MPKQRVTPDTMKAFVSFHEDISVEIDHKLGGNKTLGSIKDWEILE
jgi:hypothetical protein